MPRGSCSCEQESVREEARPSEARTLQVLSLGPVLPQFSDRAASAMSMQVSRRSETGAGLHECTTVQVGSRVEDEDRMDGGGDSGSGSHDGREYNVPQGSRSTLVLVQPEPVISAVAVPSLSDHLSDGGSPAFHPVGGRGAPLSDHPSMAVGTGTMTESGPQKNLIGLGVKLEKCDGSTCLQTFLASVKNFSRYYWWSEEDELFCLRANFKGPEVQVLRDLSSQVTLEDLVKLLACLISYSTLERAL